MKKILLTVMLAIAMIAAMIVTSPMATVSSAPASAGSPVTTLAVAPEPIFIAHPFAGSAPLRVAFEDHSVNSPTSWSWDFGDGNASAEQSPVNIYGTPGRYTVSLTVANAAGSNTVVYTDYINVRAPAAPLPTLAPAPGPTAAPRPTPMKPMPPMKPW